MFSRLMLPLAQVAADGMQSLGERMTQSLGEMAPWIKLGIAVLLVVGSYVLGRTLSRRFRMPDHGWKISLAAFAVCAATVITLLGWPPKLGVDLSGGLNLVYEIKPADAEKDFDTDEMVKAISRRIDPGNTKQTVIRTVGQRQIEIIIPRVGPSEIAEIKKKIVALGTLEFRILCNRRDHLQLIKQGNATQGNRVYNPSDNTEIARWVPFRYITEEGNPNKGKQDPEVVNRFHAERLSPRDAVNAHGFATRVVTKSNGKEEVQILVRIDKFNVNGGYLVNVGPGTDKQGGYAVNFTFNGEGARRFGGLTRLNQPIGDFKRHLAIILDGQLSSAPTINSVITDTGQISGGFGRKERDSLIAVLKAGQLPAELNPEPISEARSSATLGADTVNRGLYSMLASMIIVLVFMMFYYRFAGIVACMALVGNLVMILAIMISINAAFTLPGLAGLVLTVGMAVDANVLIFERMREETARGAALRMAIRNGFGRATTTIVDANVTTLITATVLYAIGTDQIRGFAVTLWLGILMSMFTAIFCSRIVFDVAEKRRWITKAGMLQLLSATNFNFIGRRYLAAVFSIALIVIGMGAVVMRGHSLLDIDFTGGTKAEIVFAAEKDGEQPINIAYVRSRVADWSKRVEETTRADFASVVGTELLSRLQDRLAAHAGEELSTELALAGLEELTAEWADRLNPLLEGMSVTEGQTVEDALIDNVAEARAKKVRNTPLEELSDAEFADLRDLADLPDLAISEVEMLETQDELKRFNINTSNREVYAVEAVLDHLFKGLLATNAMEYQQVAIADAPAAGVAAPGGAEEGPGEGPGAAAEPEKGAGAARDAGLPADAQFVAFQDPAPQPPASGDDAPVAAPPAEGPQPEQPAPDGPEGAEAAGDDDAAGSPRTRFALTFKEPVAQGDIDNRLRAHLDRGVKVVVSRPGFDEGSTAAYSDWNVDFHASADVGESALEQVQQEIATEPLFPATNNIGSTIAASTRGQAVAALLASLFGIVIYIWIRFQKVYFGLAAVVALVHDVLITLGFLAISAYLAGIPFIDPFKISLNILAAFLTIIGYSLNDTIVVFDRIREVRGKSPQLTGDMINTSINQTLSRTLLTSLTTLIVVAIMFFFGGQGIHGFAFALLIGVLVGTYSSIFVASPVLYWLMSRPARPAAEPPEAVARPARVAS